MIFNAFIALAGYVITAISAILPTSTGFPPDVASSIATIGQYSRVLDLVLPVSTLATIIALVLSVEVAIFAFKSVKWLISHIPLVGGRG